MAYMNPEQYKQDALIYIDVSQLPVDHTWRFHKFEGYLYIVFALLFTASLVPSYLASSGSGAGLVVLFLVWGICAGLALMGLHRLTLEVSTRFDGETFFRSRKSLFGREAWQETMAHYTGIVWRRDFKQFAKVPPWCIELQHPSRRRTVRLFQTRMYASDPFGAVYDEYCRLLDKPALGER